MSLKEDFSNIRDILFEIFNSNESLNNYLMSDSDVANMSDLEYNEFIKYLVIAELDARKLIEIFSKILKFLDKVSINKNAIDSRIEFSLQAMAHLANKYDNSNDPELKNQASVLDTCLELLANNLQKEAAEEDLRAKYRQREIDNAYKLPGETLGEINKTTENAKKISEEFKKAKEYRPMQHALSTRYCPDHPGVQTIALGDNQYQCSMDKKVYDYRNGYQTLDGDKIPGGGVEQQSKMMQELQNHRQNFDTRESRQSQ